MSGDTSVDLVWEPPAQMSSLDCWDYSIELDCLRGPEDLHLAAELGKTLLERNKELEATIKTYQTTIEDQALEIEYLKKQFTAMKEVNNSRLKVYENLETVINDLEHMNRQHENERAKDKNKIVSLRKVLEEVQNRYHDLEDKYEALKREQQSTDPPTSPRNRATLDGSIQNGAVSPTSPLSEKSTEINGSAVSSEEEMKRQLQEARQQRAKVQRKLDELMEQISFLVQEKSEMEEQLNELQEKAQQVGSLQRDVKHLEELWRGQLCRGCGSLVDRENEAPSMRLEEDEVDTRSLAESMAESCQDSGFMMQEFGGKIEPLEEESCQDSYRVLIEKYEALVKVQQNDPRRKHANSNNGYMGNGNHHHNNSNGSGGCLSLQEELQMSGEFSCNLTTSGESSHDSSNPGLLAGTAISPVSTAGAGSTTIGGGGGAIGNERRTAKGAKSLFAGTPTDFSEAETSSSGFADETSNKATQTEGRPGSFLCSIADGDDCRFSIYDDTSTFESRFHQTPEYRKLFSEIFEVLKRAAEAKDLAPEQTSGNLPDRDSITETPASEALTPLAEQCPSFGFFEDCGSEATDDTNSVVSLAVSSVASEPVFRVHTPLFSRKDDSRHHRQPAQHQQQQQQQQQQDTIGQEQSGKKQQIPSTEQLRPLHNNTRRQPLEYLSVQVRKRSAGKNNNKSRRPADSPGANDILPTTVNPRVNQLRGGGGGGRRKFRPLTASELSDGVMWNGSTAHFYPSKSARSNARHNQHQQHHKHHQHHHHHQPREPGCSKQDVDGQFRSESLEYKPGTALAEVAKLRWLEKSYAEVLRNPGNNSPRQRRNH